MKRISNLEWRYLGLGVLIVLILLVWGINQIKADSIREVLVWCLVIPLGGVAYFFPTIVAGLNHHRNTQAIAALNIFLGWTLLGWVIALVWSFTKPPKT